MGNITEKKLPTNYDYFIVKPLQQINPFLFCKVMYIFIHQNYGTHDINMILQQFKFKIDQIIGVKTTAEMYEMVKKNGGFHFRIISSAELADQVCQILFKNTKVQNIYVLGAKNTEIANLNTKWKGRIFFSKFVNDILSDFQKQNKQNPTNTNTFPKFYILKNGGTQQPKAKQKNLVRLTLFSFLKIKNRTIGREDFLKIYNYIYEDDEQREKEINKFLNNYQIIVNPQDFIEYHQNSLMFSRLLNSFLKYSDDILELSYMRYPFILMLNSIKKIYISQPISLHQKNTERYYKPVNLNQSDLDELSRNVGLTFQILGFMKAFEDYVDLNEATTNSVIIINIKNAHRDESADFGYIQLRKITGEASILFNALNSFKIESVTKQKNVNIITLKYGQLAQILKQKNKYQELKPYQQAIYENHNMISKYLNHQSDIYFLTERYKQWIEHEVLLLNKYTKQDQYYQHRDPNPYFQKGQTFKNLKKYKEALQQFYLSLKYEIIQNGQNTYTTALLYDNIADVYYQLELFQISFHYYNKSLKIKEELYGQDHSTTGIAYYNLARIYNKLKSYKQSLQLYQDALVILKKNIGEKNETIAGILNNIGKLFFEQSQYEKARQYYQSSLEIYLEIVGQNHLYTAIVYNNIGESFFNQSKMTQAIPYYQTSYVIKKSIFGIYHQQTLLSYKVLETCKNAFSTQ